MKNLPIARRGLLVLSVLTVVLLALAPAALAAPENDDFSAATVLPAAVPVSLTGSTAQASKEVGESDHAGDPGGRSVWFSWTPTADAPIAIRNGCSFGGPPILVAVYTGSSVGGLALVAEQVLTEGCFSPGTEVEFEADAGTTYRIAVDTAGGVETSFTLPVATTPANDEFASAEVVPANPDPYLSGTTQFAGKEPGEPDHAAEPGGHSVWYSWTPDVSGPVSISTCTSFYSVDTVLAVYTGATLGGLTPIAANDDTPQDSGSQGCSQVNSEVRFVAEAGTTYRVAADLAAGRGGRFGLQFRGRPGNDAFADAQAVSSFLPGFPATASQVSNVRASKQPQEPDHAGEAGGASVWFSWTATKDGPVRASACVGGIGPDPEFEPVVAAYTGSDLGSLTPIGSDDGSSSWRCGAYSEVVFDAVVGTTYRFAVDSKGGAEGRFDFMLDFPPANDDFAAAQALTPTVPAFASTWSGLASKQAGEPNHAGGAGGHSLWYSWTAPQSGPMLASSCSFSEFGPDTLIGVYTGASVGSLTEVAANDDAPGCGPGGSAAQFTATAGITYLIAVDLEGGAPGASVNLQLEGPPANDSFASAEVLEPNQKAAGGSPRLASKQAGEPNHAGSPGGHSLWYSWTPDTSGPVSINTCARTAGVDPLLGIYTGTSLGSLSTIASNDDAAGPLPPGETCGASDSEAVFDAVAGTTYRIAVDFKGLAVGPVALELARRPANDDFATPTLIGENAPISASGTAKLASKQVGEPNHAGSPGGHSLWYSWTPAQSRSVAIGTCSNFGTIDTVLAVYTGATLGALTPVAGNDDTANKRCNPGDSEVQIDAVAGTTYRIAVDGKGGSTGGFQVMIEGVAANDNFASASSFGGLLPAADTFSSNRFAGKQAGEPNHAGSSGGSSVWFKWTAPISGQVSVDTCGSSFDTLLGVYTGATLPTLTQVAANDNGSGACAPQSKLSFSAVANTAYRIAVDGVGGAEGSIELRLSARPRNDDFAVAKKLAVKLPAYGGGSNRLAGLEVGEPDHGAGSGGHSVWFSWTPQVSGPVVASLCGAPFDPVLGVYTGSTLASLAPVVSRSAATVACGDGIARRLDAVAGTTYRIAVDGAGGDDGQYELLLAEAGPEPRRLTVGKAGAGSGTVSSSPPGISCGADCTESFEFGTTVTLSAAPDAGSAFAGWAGGGCSGTGICQITLGADATVTATFQPLPPGGGESVATPPPPAPPVANKPKPKPKPKPLPKPLKCKPGFKKVKVKGKQKCVKKKANKPRGGKGKR